MTHRIVPTPFGCDILTPNGPMPIRQVLGIGLNYAAHAREQGSALPERPVVFVKSPAGVIPDNAVIRIPKICQDREQVDFEGELAIVIGLSSQTGLPCKDVPRERVGEFIMGYAAANDVSARWWQKTGSGGQFCRGKSFDTFCPIGDIQPAALVPNPNALRLTTRLNGQVMQDSSTSDMIFDCITLVSELSRGTTLLPGTVIVTGTPSGVGMARTPQVWLKAGDTVEVSIEGVGKVTSRVEVE